MGAFNLDAAKAARREAIREAPVFTYGGETFNLPVELPVAALDTVAGIDPDNMTDAQAVQLLLPILRAVLGDDDWSRFQALRPSLADCADLAEWMWQEYGVTPPTPSQSPQSARATGQRSKRTSSGNTASTRARSRAAS